MRVLVLRLSPFEDVQRSTPHLFLAAEVRAALPDAFVDMAFLPRPADARLMEEAGLPLILGTQSHRPGGEFDLLLVSNSWLLEQVNLPHLLASSGMPLTAAERGEEWPPLILGGSNASASHALVTPQGGCVADAIFFGEGEGAVGALVARFHALRDLPRRERLRRIAEEIPGLWVAGAPSAVRRARAQRVGAAAGRGAPVLPGPEAGTARVSITAGCPCRCSFCFEGYDRAPFRTIDSGRILEQARQLKQQAGASTLEVESFTFSSHPDLTVLLLELHRLFLRVNLMSQRADVLARTSGLLDLQVAADKHSFSLGVEGISARLRALMQKGLTEEDLRRAVGMIHERPTRELKLFYILTGRESEEDFAELAAFLKWLKEVRRRAAAAPRVVLSFGLLVRMPFTPLAHDPVSVDERAWRPLIGRAKSVCETNGFEYRLSSSWPKFLASQALARGGPGAHELLGRLASAGSITDAGLSEPARRATREWWEARGLKLDGEPETQPGPYDSLDDDERQDFLRRRYQRAVSGKDAPSLAPRPPVDRAQIEKVRGLVARKRHLAPVLMPVDVPLAAAGMGRQWIDAWLLRDFLARLPEQADNVLSVSETLVSGSGILGEECRWYGRTTAEVIAWDTGRLRVGTRILAPADHQPAEITLRIRLPADLHANPAQSLAEYLRDAHAPVTLERAGEGMRLSVPEKSRKKKLLLSGSALRQGDDWVMDLRVGPRPFVEPWLRVLGGADAVHSAEVELTPPAE